MGCETGGGERAQTHSAAEGGRKEPGAGRAVEVSEGGVGKLAGGTGREVPEAGIQWRMERGGEVATGGRRSMEGDFGREAAGGAGVASDAEGGRGQPAQQGSREEGWGGETECRGGDEAVLRGADKADREKAEAGGGGETEGAPHQRGVPGVEGSSFGGHRGSEGASPEVWVQGEACTESRDRDRCTKG